MNALIVYESMFGNTRIIAEAIAGGLAAEGLKASVIAAATAPRDLRGYERVFVGAPTHAHSLPQPASRTEAAAWATDPSKDLVLEPTAAEPGVREWLDEIEDIGSARFAVFSTRADIPRIFSGNAASRIAKSLRRRGAHVDAEADFRVDLRNRLADGEDARARDWASDLIPASTHQR